MYGIPLQGITPIPTPDDPSYWLKWSASTLSQEGSPISQELLIPPPPDAPPEGWYYPIAPSYKLNTAPDDRFRRRYRYSASYNPNDASNLHDLYVKVKSHPKVSVNRQENHNNSMEFLQIPGMVQMVPGVPFIFEVGGDPKKSVTVGCVHTLQSLKDYPESQTIQELTQKLQILTWGAKDSGLTYDAVYKLPSLKRNERSARPSASTSFEGSYNLASTVVKGQGQGTFAPAVQSDTREARSQISAILKTLHSLYNLIMPLSISREEWEILSYIMAENNVFTFGNGGVGPTGCQLNISGSSSGGNLQEDIGVDQGSWHIDQGDDPLTHSLLVMLLRIPPGM